MADNNKQRLMADFPPVSTEKWEEVITADLKGADYQKRLVWKTAEGFDVRPYYRAEDLEKLHHLETGPGQFPYVRGTGSSNRWLIQQTVDVLCPEEANRTALAALAAGTETICFRVKSKDFNADDLRVLLSGIDLSVTEVTFTGRHIEEIAAMVIEKADGEGAEPMSLNVNFAIDPIVSKLSLRGKFGCCEDGSLCFSRIKELIEKGEKYKKLRFIGVAGHQFHNSGSTIVQELAFTLAAGHEYVVKLMEAGLTAEKASRSIRFSMAVSSNYFMEIAKFRAARMLWANIMKQYDTECCRADRMCVHAVTSDWNMTVYDPYVNMLRGTTEAMSGALSGIHSLEVLPFNAAYESPTEFSARIARNVQLLLKNESHFDSVVDPAGGSYYIETLTASIAEQAWNLFKQVEEKGGYIAAFTEGFIQDAVASSAAKKDMNIATRREILLGTNQYPNFTEVAGQEVTECTVSRDCCHCGCDDCNCCCEDGQCTCDTSSERCECGDDCTCGCDCGCDECSCGCDCEGSVKRLHPYRGAMAFEQMRLRVDRSGKEPKAFMLTAGTLGMARARSQFACNFFACAGIRVVDNTFFADAEMGAREALASGAEIVVMCAADDDYAVLAPRVKEILGDKAILVIAGAPASAEELKAQGITNFISVKSNVLETLGYYLSELGI